MSNITVLGANVPRASEETIQVLIDLGVIYPGDDGELHVNENIPTQTAKIRVEMEGIKIV